VIDVQERGLGLEGEKLGFPSGNDQVGHLLVHDRQQAGGGGVLDNPGVGVHQPLHPVKVLKGRVLGAGGQDLHPQLPQGVHHGPGLDPAGEEDGAFPRKFRPVGGDPLAALRLFILQQPLHPVLHDPLLKAVHSIVQLPGDIPQRLGRVGHSVERLLDVGHAVVFLHLLRQVGEGLGADDHVQLCPVGIAELLEFRVAGKAGEYLDAEAVEQGQHPPEVAGDVVLADQVDGVLPQLLRLGRADDVLVKNLARQAVADVLVADKAGGIDRNDRHRHLLAGSLADRLHVVAGHGGDAGGIDEDRLCLGIADRQLLDRPVELLLAAEDDIVLQHLGGEAAPVELGIARSGTPVVPGVAGAGDGAVHQVDDVGDRHQHNPGAVIGAGAFRPLPRLRLLAELGGPLLLVGIAFGCVVIIRSGHDGHRLSC